jgi:hypothetical protein
MRSASIIISVVSLVTISLVAGRGNCIDCYIREQASAEHADEYRPAHLVSAGRIHGCSSVAVVYTLEPRLSNAYTEYLAIFAHTHSGLEFVTERIVGRKYSIVHLTGLEHQGDDAACCASAPVRIDYRLVGDLLERTHKRSDRL